MDLTQEIALARASSNGDKEAFCALYGRYKDKLYRYALYRLGIPEQAEDAVSECVLTAWKGIRQLRSDSAFGAWIFGILRNTVAGMIRSEIRARENLQDIYEQTHSDADTGKVSDIELAEALSILSDEDREIVLLSVVSGLTSAEIAGITGLKPGSVRSRLSRSLARMREFLQT